jgi:hypothetical protein
MGRAKRDSVMARRNEKESSDSIPRVGRAVHHKILQTQRTAGNQAVAQRLRVGAAHDRLETEASRLGRASAATPVREARGEPATRSVVSALREPSAGEPLPDATRRALETRLQTDLAGVRLHVDDAAARMNAALRSRAFALGPDVYVPPAEFRPGTPAGQQLLAHEVAHTIQQSKGAPLIQRQPATSQPAITAQGTLGLPAGSRIVITRSMNPFFFGLLSSNAPEVAASLTAVSDQTATVTTATDDLIEARLEQAITLPASGSTPARTIHDLTITLRRTASGHFDFLIAGREGEQTATLYQELDLTPSRDGDAVVLSAGSEPHLRMTPATSPTGSANIQAYTAPYLVGRSALVRSAAPATLGLVALTRLPDVPAGTAASQAAVQRVVEQAASRLAEPRQTVTLGGGIAGGVRGGGVHPLLTASWRYSFRPSDTLGGLLQIPLNVDVPTCRMHRFLAPCRPASAGRCRRCAFRSTCARPSA